MNNLTQRFFVCAMAASMCTASIQAQESAADSVLNHTTGTRLKIGGYGEIGYSRNFYSDHVSRYSQPEEHKNDPSHGKFDIPHAVIYMGYDFGRGWTFGTEIEFEHGGNGLAYEKEDEEGGEWEQEVEKGGEVELEQFWIQKAFSRAANLRFGHIVVPVGLTNAHHEPLNFFTVYRPEGEYTILPSTWHQTGMSFWGRSGDFRYEAQLLAGLNADNFTNVGWIRKGHKSPLEYDVANKYGVALRVDNYTVKGLRIGLSGYYGHSIGNTYPAEKDGLSATYKGKVAIGAFDFTYNDYNWIVRGQADYGYLSDADQLKYMYNRKNSKSPFKHSAFVSGNAYAVGIEAGYNVFSQIESLRKQDQKFFVFGRYEQYNPYASDTKSTPYGYTEVKRFAAGFNYLPVKEVVIKAEYSMRLLKEIYNDEPSLNIGVAYEGFFDTGHRVNPPHVPSADIEHLNERINQLQQQLTELQNKPEKVEQVINQTTTIVNPYVINFAKNSANLTENARLILDGIAAGSNVRIVGTTSPEGSEPHNNALSEKRSAIVADYLQKRSVNVIQSNGVGTTGTDSQRAVYVYIEK